jgi:hypothetical protein
MSVQKKSLISNRAAVKKAILATKGPDLSKATHKVLLAKPVLTAKALTKPAGMVTAKALTKRPGMVTAKALTKRSVLTAKALTKPAGMLTAKALTKSAGMVTAKKMVIG